MEARPKPPRLYPSPVSSPLLAESMDKPLLEAHFLGVSLLREMVGLIGDRCPQVLTRGLPLEKWVQSQTTWATYNE